MKLASWNVNGLRACLKKGFMDTFAQINADVFCIQETKMQQGQAELDFGGHGESDETKESAVTKETAGSKEPIGTKETAGSKGFPIFSEYWNSAEKKGYSGTAIFTRIPPLTATYGMGIGEHDREGRIITLEFKEFYLVNVYVPNSQRELLRLDYRMRWEDDFRQYVCRLDTYKPVIICGDLNCAHKEIDIKHAKSNERNAGFTREERDKLTLLLDAGFTDFYRRLNPDKSDAYTWWSYMQGAREKNVGWRIDYFLGSDRLMDKVRDAFILPEFYGSDHCPVGLVID